MVVSLDFKSQIYQTVIFETIINMDLLDQIIKYIDHKTLINLLLSCKKTFTIYKNNKKTVNLKIINSIMHKFNYYNFTFNTDDSMQISKNLLNIYNNLDTIKHRHRLIYIIKNKLESLELFKFFTNDYIYKLSEFDIQYIITYCNMDQLNIFLRVNNVSCKTILDAIIDRYNYNDLYFNNIVKIFIQYIFFKYHFNKFNSENNSSFHNILIFLIKTGNKDCVEYIICDKKNKYKKKLNYQLLVNQCIEIKDIYFLNKLIKEIQFDNLANTDKVYVTIHYKYIFNLSRDGAFWYLQYLVENFIGYNINANLYIQNICDGLNNNIYIQNESGILLLNEYLTTENKLYINSYFDKNIFKKTEINNINYNN